MKGVYRFVGEIGTPNLKEGPLLFQVITLKEIYVPG